jgi:excisionase family DNA binding protein
MDLGLLTVEEVATALRTSKKAVYQMFARGRGPRVTKIGRRKLVRREDLLHFLDDNRSPSLTAR